MSQYDQNWQCRNAINCGCYHISDQSEEDGELCQDCYDELQERENRFAGLVAENAKLKEELAAYKKASDPMGGGLRSLEWRFVWHGSGGNENWNRRGGRIVKAPTNGDELLYVGENKSDLEDAELLIAKHNADLLFVAQSKQAQIDRLKKALTGMVNHEEAANAREGLEPSMELQFAQEVLGLEC
ncbi:MAG: hypothetical protein VXW65_03905 [Pseudomonadota bacterium]|nr:hypothetical protein [Pseudomonadota bacterium]